MPVSMISRIEIVRGPGSAIHGADAFAGTINVITKDGQEIDGTEIGVRAGSFDTYDFWAQYGKNSSGWDMYASFEALLNKTDQNRVIKSDLQTILDSISDTSVSHAPDVLNDDRKHYSFMAGARKGNWTGRLTGLRMWSAGVGVGAALALDPDSHHASDRYIAEFNYENINSHSDWNYKVNTNFTYLNDDNNYVIFPPGVVLENTTFTEGYIGQPDEINKIASIEAISFYYGLAQHRFRFSLGYQNQKFEAEEKKNFGPGVLDGSETSVNGTLTDVTGTPYVYGPNKTRELMFFTLQDEWTVTRSLELTAGVRVDEYSDFGRTTNPRAALVWQTRYDLTSKLLYGRAFRAPSISELFGQNNPLILGNKNVNPETIDTLELAFDYHPRLDLRLKTNFYFYEINGLIDFVTSESDASKTAQNIRDQKGYGTELEAYWKIKPYLKLKANSAWHRAIDKDTNKIIPNIPRLQMYGNIYYEFKPDWTLDTQGIWIGYRARPAGDTRKKINDYMLANLTLRKNHVVRNIDIAFAVRNILDTDVREPSNNVIPNDFPMNSRSFWIELRAKL